MSKSIDKSSAGDDLRAAGIDPSTPADQAVAQLQALKGRADLSVIARAASHLEVAAAAALLAELEASAHGAARREVRRALFRLQQRGVQAPVTEKPRIAGRGVTGGDLSGLISPIDSEGARVVWILKGRSNGGFSRLWGLTSDREGLLAIDLTSVGSRELREERNAFEQRAQVKLVEADWRLADYLLCEAFRATAEERRGRVGRFLMLRMELIASPPPQTEEFSHPIYQEFADSLASPPSAELLAEPEAAIPRFSQEELAPVVEEVREVSNSPLVLNQFQQQERINAVLRRALGRLLVGERLTNLRRRLEDAAYYLARCGKTRQAAWAAAAAHAIRSGADLAAIGFFVDMIGSQVRAAAEQGRTAAGEQARLIMTPAEAMRAQAARRRS